MRHVAVFEEILELARNCSKLLEIAKVARLALHAVQVEAADAEHVVDAHRRPLRPHDLRHAVDAAQPVLQRIRRLGADLPQGQRHV